VSVLVPHLLRQGDAEKPELTKQFNEGYKTDLAEPGEAGGKDEISEVKLWTLLRGGLPVGVGRTATGGNPGSVGDKFAFGNTEERARLAIMGCKQRGFCGQRAFDHTTGQGYVKSQRGHYHEGLDGAASDTIPSELSLELMLMEARVECRLI